MGARASLLVYTSSVCREVPFFELVDTLTLIITLSVVCLVLCSLDFYDHISVIFAVFSLRISWYVAISL